MFSVTDAKTTFLVTDKAAAKVKELIDAEGNPELALRVAVRPGGCSGLSYEMFFDSDIADDDQRTEYGGVTVVIDPASGQHLGGAQLDYKDGLNESGFSISNPNAHPLLRLRAVVLLAVPRRPRHPVDAREANPVE